MTETRSALCFSRPVERRFFISINPFHTGHVGKFSKLNRIQDDPYLLTLDFQLSILVQRPVESKIRTHHGPVGSERPGERPGGVEQDRVPIEIFAQETKSSPFHPRHRRNVASTSLQKHEQAKFYVNRRRNKMSGRPPVYQRLITRTRSALFSLAAEQ